MDQRRRLVERYTSELRGEDCLATIRFMLSDVPDDLNENLTELLRKLDRVVARLAAIQQMPRSYGTDVQIHSTEIHTVQAIGENEDVSLTQLAKHMGVTKGALSQTVAKLTRKGLVTKRLAPGNAREIRVALTDSGWTAHRNHEAFDRRILSAIEEHCGSATPRMVKRYLEVLRDFEDILELLGTSNQQVVGANQEDDQ
jgi:DNA-binding MarR family transcriptional regulator